VTTLEELVGKETVLAWAAAGAEYIQRSGWWILKGEAFTPCGLYKDMYPKLYESNEDYFDLPTIDLREYPNDFSS
jgi:hypothetical protein